MGNTQDKVLMELDKSASTVEPVDITQVSPLSDSNRMTSTDSSVAHYGICEHEST